MQNAALELTKAREAGNCVLAIEDVGKCFGGVIALTGVSLEVHEGTIHGLLGENGAGKSTLVGIICGQIRPSSGRILLHGQPIAGLDVRAMEEAGVFRVTQEPMIIDHVTAAENLFLGIWPQSWGFVRWRSLRAEARRMLEGSGIDPQAQAGHLSAVARRKLNILRAMFSGGRIIILDEPTAALTVADRRHLFDFMQALKRDGVTFIFISHYNDEILEVCDAVSVLRDGKLVGSTDRVARMTSAELSELVLGRELDLFQRQRLADETAPALTLSNVRATDLSLERLVLRQGEVLGLTGLPGAGAKELARALFGLQPAAGGEIAFGTEAPRRLPPTPAEAFTMGIAYLSDDRRRDGVVGHLSIGENIALSSLRDRMRAGFVDFPAEESVCARYFRRMGIKAPNFLVPVNTLSGGNQQKVCLGRVLAANPRLLILDEPTRGIDVGVKQEVLRIIDGLSRQGVSVIIVSTDTDELVRAVDRICIFRDGTIAETISGGEISTERLRGAASRA